MNKIRRFIKKLSKSQKIIYSAILFIIVLILGVTTVTLANSRNIHVNRGITYWDGTVAASFKSGLGTIADPYVISNGKELAYLSMQLETNNYKDNHFVLENDIFLNEGIFSYIDDEIVYILDNVTYYVDPYTNNYYSDTGKTNAVGTVNIFPPLNNFKGIFNGNLKTITGLYISSTEKEVGLFTNLEGLLNNLRVINSAIYGGSFTGGIASTASNSNLGNILFDGVVVGIEETEKTITIDIPEVTFSSDGYIDVLEHLPFIGGNIVSSSISGNVVSEVEDLVLKVNEEDVLDQTFDLTLGSEIKNILVTSESLVTLNNLKYTITYNEAATGGIIGQANNVRVTNAINKGLVSGISSGGLIGKSANNSVETSYNTGPIVGELHNGGLIGVIEKGSNVTINKSFNSNVSTSLVDTIFNSETVTLSNVFNLSNDHILKNILDSFVTVENSYYSGDSVLNGSFNGSFTLKTKEELEDKEFLISLGFSEYVSEDDRSVNKNNTWVYKENESPVLFNDTKLDSLATIAVSNYIFDDLKYDLDSKVIKRNITFAVEETNIFMPVKEKYYYVSNTVLTLDEIENINTWTSVLEVNQITDEGSYVIYVKIIDVLDQVNYLNTDLLILDFTSPVVSADLGADSFNDIRTNLNEIYLEKEIPLLVNATDLLSGIKSIEYYVSDQVLSETELEEITDWILDDETINLHSGTNIYYIKVTDNSDNVTIINTDYILINGYTYTDFYIGRNSNSYEHSKYLSSKSKLTFNIEYLETEAIDNTYHTHNLVSNTLLPVGTVITLTDRITGKVYDYVTAEDDYSYLDDYAIYPFTLFKEKGKFNESLYIESSYFNNDTIHEDFIITLDFKDADITENYNNVKLHLELHDSLNEIVRETLSGSIEEFNIVYTDEAAVDMEISGDTNSIIMNRDSYTEIDITSKIKYSYFNNNKVIDTKYEDKTVGLLIKLTNSLGKNLASEHFEHMTIMINDTVYPIDEYGTIKYMFNNGINDSNITLKVATTEHVSALSPGTYSLRITTFASYDGNYEGADLSAEANIPLIVLSDEVEEEVHYSFDVKMDKSKHIIDSINGNTTIKFDLVVDGEFDDPNVRVSLYRKDEVTAYNQSYTLVDLSDYVSNSLESYVTNVYYVPLDQNKFNLNLLMNSFDYNGYKLVFDLYDGNNRIDSVKKYFIIK